MKLKFYKIPVDLVRVAHIVLSMSNEKRFYIEVCRYEKGDGVYPGTWNFSHFMFEKYGATYEVCRYEISRLSERAHLEKVNEFTFIVGGNVRYQFKSQ